MPAPSASAAIWAAWSTDLSLVYGHNEIDYRTENSLNTSYGPASPNSFDSGGLRFGQLTANLDVTREFELGLAKPLTFAFGAEYRDENFKIRPGQIESYAAGPFFVAPRATTAANCTASGGVYTPRPASAAFPGRAALVGRAGLSRASRRRRRPIAVATAMPAMSSSTPTSSTASRSPLPVATSISPISATR